jgi:hypothetical protein
VKRGNRWQKVANSLRSELAQSSNDRPSVPVLERLAWIAPAFSQLAHWYRLPVADDKGALDLPADPALPASLLV